MKLVFCLVIIIYVKKLYYLVYLSLCNNNKMTQSKLQIDHVYKMTSNPLGFCVIINIVNFDGNDEIDDLKEKMNLLELTIVAIKDAKTWQKVFVNHNKKSIRFNPKEKFHFKHLIEAVNLKYKDQNKCFKKFKIQNDNIESIQDNHFDGIRFNEVDIKTCSKF